jgi:inhibitor of cysteine peptidase
MIDKRGPVMSRLINLPVALLIAIIFIVACGTTHSLSLRLTDADNDSQITIHPGDILEVALAGNPTTGYSWEVQEGAEAVLRQKGAPEYKAESERIGAGGTMAFRFECIAVGAVTVSLLYRRSFEPGVVPLKTFIVKVRAVKK